MSTLVDSTSKVLLFTIEKTEYPISVQVLHTICFPTGPVLRIVVFWTGERTQAMVELDSATTAARVMNSLQGRNIYPDCCTISIEFAKVKTLNVRENCWSRWDYSVRQRKNLFEIFYRKAPLLADPVYLPFRPEQDVFATPYLLEKPFPCRVHVPDWLFQE